MEHEMSLDMLGSAVVSSGEPSSYICYSKHAKFVKQRV